MNQFDNIDRDQEDRGREQQLDASFEDWYRNIEYWVNQKEDMTRVPKENAYDTAVNMDIEQE
jgi:DNA phosphorothioation-dependent restriction protein DptG